VHVALVGLMGAGKTTVGRRAAKLLGRAFVDADEAFIPRYGRAVAEVFAQESEPVFRAMESELLAEVLSVASPLVLATGGGVVVSAANRARLADPSVFVVYLHGDAAFIASRARAKADRFLLADHDPAEVLGSLYLQRDAWYREVADEVIEVASFHEWGSQPKQALAKHVAELTRAHEANLLQDPTRSGPVMEQAREGDAT